MTTKTKTTPIEQLAARIAELEAENKELQDAPFVNRPAGDVTDDLAAAQGRITARKNNTPDLVQLTPSGNVRTTRDPSDQFVSEQATSGVYGDEALAAEAHTLNMKETK